jgi:hypothetical protein
VKTSQKVTNSAVCACACLTLGVCALTAIPEGQRVWANGVPTALEDRHMHRPGSLAPARWSSAVIAIQLGLATRPDGLSTDAIERAASAAVAAWNAPSCSGVKVTLQTLQTAARGEAGDDLNTIAFRKRTWCHADDPGLGPCFDHSIAAVTTLQFDRDAPEERPQPIVEADIELNAVDFSWRERDGEENKTRRVVDLTAALTHEIGHVLGLAHSCTLRNDHARGPKPCSSADRKSVMFPCVRDPREPLKPLAHSLSASDVRALCAAYPHKAR